MILKKVVFSFILFFFLTLTAVGTEGSNAVCIGITGGSDTFDPAHTIDSASTFFTFNIYDKLVRFDPQTYEIKPGLAESWETRDRGTAWIFKLRKGVKFHDGTDFTAQSVVFNFQRQMVKDFKHHYYDFPLFKEIFPHLEGIQALDRYTVAFYLNKPFYPFLASLSSDSAAIVSPTAVKRYKKKFPLHPCGTGPYKLKLREKGKRIVLEANPDYWRGAPPVNEFVFVIISQLEAMQRMFIDQKIDIMLGLSISRTKGLKRLNWVSFHRSTQLTSNFLAINLEHKYLKRRNIRKALWYLWDKRIITYVYQEYAVAADSIIPPTLPGYRNITGEHEFSLEKALQLLKKEKIKKPIELDCLIYEKDSLTHLILSYYAKRLKPAGIQLKIQQVPANEFDKRATTGAYALIFSGWVADYPDPHTFISPMLSKTLMQEGFPNFSAYEGKSLRTKVDAAAAESVASKRVERYKEIVGIIDDETLYIPLYFNTMAFFYNNRTLEPITGNPLGVLSLYDIKKK